MALLGTVRVEAAGEIEGLNVRVPEKDNRSMTGADDDGTERYLRGN